MGVLRQGGTARATTTSWVISDEPFRNKRPKTAQVMDWTDFLKEYMYPEMFFQYCVPKTT